MVGFLIMLYTLYEFMHASAMPIQIGARMTRLSFQNPFTPLSATYFGRTMSASAEMLERMTRRFGKPEFGLDHTEIDGKKVKITEEIIREDAFCNLVRFKRHTKRNDPKVLIVAPLSGHYATLLRGTVKALLPHHDVYITDWMDARMVPLSEGRFNLDDCIAYLIDYMTLLGNDSHVVAVCQPAVPVLAAVSIMAQRNDKVQPASMTLMGGPVDPRIKKTQVTELAETRPLSWFKNNVITTVPLFYPGAMRQVYPGFIQLSGFMSMNLDRHIGKHMDFYNHLIDGDGDSAAQHRKFYDEYLSVMDLTEEFYLQTVETVFQRHDLPQEKMIWTDPKTGEALTVKPSMIKKTAILTVEGENDDISAPGQTVATHDLCSALADDKKFHHLQKDVGHYGIFNGRRWRELIMPRLRHFMRMQTPKTSKISDIPAQDLERSPDLEVQLWKDTKKAKLKVVSKDGKKSAKA
jgi:poly(3-hydroxybutyrate) depolymerase